MVSEFKFGHFNISWPPLTSVTSKVGWKTSNWGLEQEKKSVLENILEIWKESLNFCQIGAWSKKKKSVLENFLEIWKEILSFSVLDNLIGIFGKTPSVQYHQYLLRDESANVNNYFLLFATHSFTKL